MPSTPAVSEWATKEDLGSCSASCLSDFPLGPSGKGGGFVGAFGAPRSPPPGRIPPSARLFCDQYTPSGLFLPCHQGTRCGLFDEMSDGLRLRHIQGVAALTSTTVEPARLDIAR